MKKVLGLFIAAAFVSAFMVGCGDKAAETPAPGTDKVTATPAKVDSPDKAEIKTETKTEAPAAGAPAAGAATTTTTTTTAPAAGDKMKTPAKGGK